jgi:ankyrin repeat protein
VFEFFEKIDYTSNDNETIRKFFDLSFIDERHKIHNAIINNLGNIEKILHAAKNPGELINIADNAGRTAMHLVAMYDNSSYATSVILSYFANFQSVDEIFKWYPISYAMYFQNIAVCDMICAIQSPLDYLFEAMKSNVNYFFNDYVHLRILMIAALHDFVEIGQILIENDVDVSSIVNIRFEHYFNYTLLHFAVKSRSVKFVKFLVEHDADVHLQNGLRKTPIDYAIRFSNEEIVETLIDIARKTDAQFTPTTVSNLGLIINDWASTSLKTQMFIQVIKNNRLRFRLATVRDETNAAIVSTPEDMAKLIERIIDDINGVKKISMTEICHSGRNRLKDISSEISYLSASFESSIKNVRELKERKAQTFECSTTDISELIQNLINNVKAMMDNYSWEAI